MWNGSSVSNATPCLRATSSAAFNVVPASSMNVSGRAVNESVSLEAIHRWRGESISLCLMRRALVIRYLTTPSAEAQPTHDPVLSWLLIFHHEARRSTDAGSAAASMAPTAMASFEAPVPFGVMRRHHVADELRRRERLAGLRVVGCLLGLRRFLAGRCLLGGRLLRGRLLRRSLCSCHGRSSSIPPALRANLTSALVKATPTSPSCSLCFVRRLLDSSRREPTPAEAGAGLVPRSSGRSTWRAAGRFGLRPAAGPTSPRGTPRGRTGRARGCCPTACSHRTAPWC